VSLACSPCSTQLVSFLVFFFGPDQHELAYPAHRMVLKTTSGNQGSGPPSSTTFPQMTVAADLTRSEDDLSLIPGDAVGDCHARRPPNVHEAQRL
jgi:hypothetical protein